MTGNAALIRIRERNAGLLLIAATGMALLIANSGFGESFHHFLETRLGPTLPRFGQISLHQWVADGLMAVFFLLVGLEVKREWFEGRLAMPEQRRLPVIAAAAGMAVPAIFFLLVTGADPALIRGWAIPSATDIAFAIGVLALLGRRSSPSLKILLVTIAIVDDIGAVIIIALVYTSDLSFSALALSLLIVGAMVGMNRLGVCRLWPYLAGFAALWLAMLASGIHPTIAGVLAALTVPLGSPEARSPLKMLEHAIHPWVMFAIMPLFGLVSAGVVIATPDALASPLPLGIAAGLFLGKQLGVFGALWLVIRSGLSPRPLGTNWAQLYGGAMLCGIGFTMSLFIGALAFPAAPELVEGAKLGTLAGSLLSAVLGFLILRLAPVSAPVEADEEDAAEVFAEDQDE